MSHPTCHDFKSIRVDASRRLPPVYAIVPIIFYLALLGGSYFYVTSYVAYSKATEERDSAKQNQAEHEAAKAKTETVKAGLLKEKAKAEKLAQWIEGTRALQPITVALSRAMPAEVTLGQLALERSPELPSQIILTMLVNNGTVEDVGRIQQSVSALNYHPYNAQQSRNGDTLEFRTMLVWQQMQ